MNKKKHLKIGIFIIFLVTIFNNLSFNNSVKADTVSWDDENIQAEINKLEESVPVTLWNSNYQNYNCYAFVINRFEDNTQYTSNGKYAPGQFSGHQEGVFHNGMSEEELAIYVKEDLENIGMTNVIIQDSIPELIYDNQELICLRVKDEDYHFMRYDKKTNAWYHKPGNSAILRYKYIPSNGLHWKSELFSFNKAIFGVKSYNSNIKFMIYTKPYVVVNCKANNMQTDFHLKDGKDVLIEMNITCDSTFYFDVDIDIDREICVFLFDHDFNKELNYLKNKILEEKVDIFEKKKITLITGKITEDYIVKKSKRIMNVFKNIDINVIAIQNDYFGHDITVTGLVVGSDIINQVKGKDLGEYIVIPEVMLKEDDDIFLDDTKLVEVAEALNTNIVVSSGSARGFIEAIIEKIPTQQIYKFKQESKRQSYENSISH